MARSSKDQETADEVMDGMARALWVTSYADWCDENPYADVPRAGAGEDWVDVAPETPEEVRDAAADLAELFDAADHQMMKGRRRYTLTMDVLWTRALEAMTGIGKYPPRTTPFDLGFDLAMQAMGHGVSWFDDHSEFDIKFPRFECHFDGEEFSWSGGADETMKAGRGKRNPDGAHRGSGRRMTTKDRAALRESLKEAADAHERVFGKRATKSNPDDGHDNPERWPSSKVQSLLFDKAKWTVAGAQKWASEHGYVSSKVDDHASKIRLRQEAPTGGPCRTIHFGAGIEAIVCAGGKGRPPGVPNPHRVSFWVGKETRGGDTDLVRKASRDDLEYAAAHNGDVKDGYIVRVFLDDEGNEMGEGLDGSDVKRLLKKNPHGKFSTNIEHWDE